MNTAFRLTLALAALTSLPALAAGPTPASPVLSCQLPAAVPDISQGQAAFDAWSWQTFVALNWPAQAGQRGAADCSKVLGSEGQTVWQTYKNVGEIFLPKGANPGPWNSPVVSRSLSTINIAAVKGTVAMKSIDQAVGGWLIDQRGNPTYYDIAANQVSYDYITGNHFYDADVVSKASNISFPNGVIEIKSSWRILTASDDASRYLTINTQVATFNDQGQQNGSEAAYLGLVGLHVITKAKGFPQWIWSTFEHVDNVPPKAYEGGKWVDKPQAGVNYSYYKADTPAATLNQSPCDWQQVNGTMTCVPQPGSSFQTPNPLNRVTPITAQTVQLNEQYQAALSDQSSVLENYQLITTQWPQQPNNPGNPLGDPAPALAANVTMESYIQPNSSCTACHSMATPANSIYKSDFSYLFIFAKSAAPSTKEGKQP